MVEVQVKCNQCKTVLASADFSQEDQVEKFNQDMKQYTEGFIGSNECYVQDFDDIKLLQGFNIYCRQQQSCENQDFMSKLREFKNKLKQKI